MVCVVRISENFVMEICMRLYQEVDNAQYPGKPFMGLCAWEKLMIILVNRLHALREPQRRISLTGKSSSCCN
jgi:hypothetical protein